MQLNQLTSLTPDKFNKSIADQRKELEATLLAMQGIDTVIEERLLALAAGLNGGTRAGARPVGKPLLLGGGAGEESKGKAEAVKVDKDTFDLYKTASQSALDAFVASQEALAKYRTLPDIFASMSAFGTKAVTQARSMLQIVPDDFIDTVKAELEQTASDVATIGANIMLPVGAVIGSGLSEGIASGIEGGVRSGLESALASGRIGDAFKAMGQSIIQSMARAMVNVALQAINFSKMLASITKFMAGHPILALAAATALLTMARAAGGGAGTGSMTAIGAAGGLTYGAAGAMGATTPTQLIFGATSATTAAGMTPRQSMNVTIIGPNDPTAQRAIQELMTKANSRGRIG